MTSKVSSIKQQHERLACLESGLEQMVNRFRDLINGEALEKINKKTSQEAAVICENNHSLKKIYGKKKDFF